MMQAPASRAALATLRERLTAVSGRFRSADGRSGLAADLYGVAGVLSHQPRLRRKLADPATEASVRSNIARQLLEGKISASALSVVLDAVALRWSSPWDLCDALELVGDEALMAAAEQAGQLDEVEDELFRFGRTLDTADELVTLLDEYGIDADRRVALVTDLLRGKVRPETLALLGQAVRSTRRRNIERSIDDLLDAAAARRARSVAKVISAVALSDRQEARLAEVLSRMYDRPISVRTSVEAGVQGGLLIRIGDEVIDGTLASRFAAARAALALH